MVPQNGIKIDEMKRFESGCTIYSIFIIQNACFRSAHIYAHMAYYPVNSVWQLHDAWRMTRLSIVIYSLFLPERVFA